MKRSCCLSIVGVVLVLFLGFSAYADELAELKFEKFELDNGLDVILHEDHSIPMVTVNVWYHVGSKNEKPGRTGFAHLFEHLMFEGSEHHNREFRSSISKYGGVNNGSTSHDRTNYWENMPSNYLETALWLEADRMGYLLGAMDQERLDLQRDIVMNERRERLDNQPYGKIAELQKSLLYTPEHPYYWHILGSMEDLEAANLETVQEFFKTYYVPNNASLCIAGDFDPAQVKKWVEEYFSSIPAGPAVDRFEKWIPDLNEVKRISAEDNISLARLYMAWPTPAFYEPGDAEFDLLSGILAGGKSSRLYKTLVYEKQIAQDVSAYQASNEISSVFNIVATIKEGHTLAEVETEINKILKDILENGVTRDELDLARVSWEADFVRGLQNVGNFYGRADRLNGYNVMLGDPGKLLWDRDRYKDATVDDVNFFIRKYIKLDGVAIVEIYPQGQYKTEELAVDMSLEPIPTAEPSFTPPTIQKTTLANGMELMLVEDNRLPLIQVNVLLKSGWADDPIDRPGVCALTSDLLNEGTKSKDALEISDQVQRLGANFGAGSYFDNSTIELNVLKSKLDPGLELMADVIMNPIFPEDELERLRENYRGRIQQDAKRPLTSAIKAFSRELYGQDHPYAQPYTGTGTLESINAVTRDDIRRFYAAHYMPNNAVAIVVGDITLNDAKAKLEKAFKKWNPGQPPSHKIADVEAMPKTRICIIDKPGAKQSAIVLGNLAIPRNNPDYTALVVANHVLGGNSSARLFGNLRQDKGYTYGAFSFLTGRKGPGAFTCYAEVQTEVTKEALIEFMKELKGIQGDIPVSNQELSEVKDNLIKGFPQDFQTLTNIAGELNNITTFDLPLSEWADYANDVRRVDTQKVLEIADKYIHPDNLLVVVVGDKEKIEQGIKELGWGDVVYLDPLEL